MWRMKTSRWLNRHLLRGKPDEMVSSRVYREKRSVWCLILNVLFLPLNMRWGHCRNAYQWERRYEATKRRTGTAQKEAPAHEAYPAALEAQNEGGDP